jgi:hypothetical protein
MREFGGPAFAFGYLFIMAATFLGALSSRHHAAEAVLCGSVCLLLWIFVGWAIS